MSYLTFHSPTGETRLSGHEVAHISLVAGAALARELARPEYRRLRAELGLPAPGTAFYTSQVSWLAGDGEAHHIQGQDVYLFDVALNLLYQQQPVTGILCWLYDQALGHGWIAAADQRAFAAEIRAAAAAGIARPAMGWDGICSLVHSGAGDVVTSLALGNEFPMPSSPSRRAPGHPDSATRTTPMTATRWGPARPRRAVGPVPAGPARPARPAVASRQQLHLRRFHPQAGNRTSPGRRASALRPGKDTGVDMVHLGDPCPNGCQVREYPGGREVPERIVEALPAAGTASWFARHAGRPGTH